MYDAGLGRFITADVVEPDLTNPQTLNRYTYCLNNPLKYVDPTGNWIQIVIAAVIVADIISDVASVVIDEIKFIEDPSLENAANLSLSTACLASPVANSWVAKGAIKAADKVIDTVKVVDKAGDAVKAADKSIVIGETATRVEKKAKELGAEWYKPKKKIFEDPNILFEQKAKNNINWYRKKVNKGYKVNDRGLDSKRSPEDRGRFYQEESRFTNKWLKEGRLKKGNYKKIK